MGKGRRSGAGGSILQICEHTPLRFPSAGQRAKAWYCPADGTVGVQVKTSDEVPPLATAVSEEVLRAGPGFAQTAR